MRRGAISFVAALAVVAGCAALRAAPPRDALGIMVDFGSATLIHRPPVTYPEPARTNRVEGTVLAQVTVDATGNVTDARTISGPDELRKGVLLSVLQWHFKPGIAGSAYQVSVTFQIVDPPQAEIITTPPAVTQQSAADAEYWALQSQMSTLSAQARDNPSAVLNQMREMSARLMALQKIGSINLYGVYEDAAKELMSDLPVHPGDSMSSEKLTELSKAVKKFDEHLTVSTSGLAGSPTQVEVRIVAPGSQVVQQIKVGANVQSAQLIKRVQPVYPPDAKAAGIQGAVRLNAVIGPEGAIKSLAAVSGHPLLVPAAMDAVKQWVYRPTMLNGVAVDVSTEIEVNFTLSK